MARPARIAITGIVHARNSAATIERALSTLRWVSELIVADMGSDDGTRDIAERMADRVVSVPIAERVDGTRNAQIQLAANEWIFVLDSDEYLPVDAADTVSSLIETHGQRIDAFSFPRFNFIAGQVMRGSGWYPDHQIRLFRKGTVLWSDHHHRAPTVVTGPGRVLTLTPPGCLHIHHLNYTDLRQFVRKQVEYALTDSYPGDPASFDFSSYLASAHEQLALRLDPGRDGDLSRALSLLMAWNAVIRGLIHWDSLEPRPPLPADAPLPGAPAQGGRLKVALHRYLRTHHEVARTLRTLLRPIRNAAARLRATGSR